MSRHSTRRRLLRAGGAAALAPLTGCLGRLAGLRGPDGVVWERSLDVAPGGLVAGPDGRTVFGNGRRETPFAYGPDGERRWRRDVRGRVAAATADRVLLRNAGRVAALDVADGSTEWSFRTGRHEIARDVAVDAGQVYVVGEQRATGETDPGEEFDRCYAFDESDGERRWVRELPHEDDRSWCVDAGDGAVFATWEGGAVRRLDADGTVRWRTSVEHPDRGDDEEFTRYGLSGGVVHDGTFYLGVYDGLARMVVALRTDRASVAWRRLDVQRVDGVADGRVHCFSSSGLVTGTRAALDPETGDAHWSTTVPMEISEFGTTLAGDVLYASVRHDDFTDPSLALRAVDAATGDRLAETTLPGSAITEPVAAGERVLVATGSPGDDSRGALEEGTLFALEGLHAGGSW